MYIIIMSNNKMKAVNKMEKPVMTLAEVVQDLRSVGMKTNANTISDGIASGIYPFGRILKTGETGRRHIQIFRSDYEQWKAKVLFGEGSDPSNSATTYSGARELISSHSFVQEDKDIIWEVIIRSWAKISED